MTRFHHADFPACPKQFFVNYHRVQGREYRPLGWKDASAAKRSIEKLKV